uniref:Epstein-Barr virus EBNA-1-like protein n=1 Tax=Oryza sativa subsp. japonica TaxID=39947 RepID=Q6YYZ6_ORYSJ|nr:Epstein-Barr virus EBNA-1-like protein [Oryza sativa Japonica Group]BAD17018.1 Epstein-Barr virus EBNA-1-like protein [Oryza sativa Japonica Group]
MELSGRAKWAGRPKLARAREGGEREPVDRAHHAQSRVGPACQRLGSPCGGSMRRTRAGGVGTRCMRAVRGGRRCDGPTRSLTACGGTRARGGTDRGRREVDDDPAAIGRRAAAASGGANHGDTGKSEHTGRLFVTGGGEPTARIRRRSLDGGGLRRRQPAAEEKGNSDEATRGRFPAVRASTRLREFDASVGLGGTTPSEAGDERVLRSSGGDGGEHMASEGNGEGEGAAEVPFRVLECTGSPGARRRTAEVRQSTGRRLWRGDEWKRREPTCAVKARAGAPASGQIGDREDDAGREEKGKRKGEKGLAPLPIWERGGGERGRRGRGRGRCLRPLAACARSGGGRAMTAGGLERSGDTGGRRGQALTTAATGRSATRHARAGKQREARWFERRGSGDRRGLAGPGGIHAGAHEQLHAGSGSEGWGDGERGGARRGGTRAHARAVRGRGGAERRERGARGDSRTREQRAGEAERGGGGRSAPGGRERERKRAQERERWAERNSAHRTPGEAN